jgi:MOSC domain-containing protein YiiM
MAEIISIVYKPQAAEQPAGRYLRLPLERARLVAGHGIEGDTKGGHARRQLNIMSAETLSALAAEGFTVDPGCMGEQIIVRGLDVNRLAVGDRLHLGDTATVEVTSLRTGCERFEAYQGKKREEAAGRLGVIARVLTGGVIQVGDAVRAGGHV